MNERLIKIGEASRMLGIDRQTLWRWEKKGLVKPLRNHVGTRYYTPQQLEDLRRMRTPKGGSNE